MKLREYSAPLTVLGAGVLGFSLICIVSAAALATPSELHAADIGAQEIVDSAFSNPISTAVALTAVEIQEYIPSPTPTFTDLPTLPPTVTVSSTAAIKKFVTWTPLPPTRTKDGYVSPTATTPPTQTPTRTPTRTLVPSPTNTATPTPTATSKPTETDTPVPPSNTPTPTSTPVPPTDTDTPSPEPTNTQIPSETPTMEAPIPISTEQNIPLPT